MGTTTKKGRLTFAAACVLSIGCQQAPSPARGRASSRSIDGEPTTEGTRRKGGQVAEVTPEIAAKASEILRANPQADFGTEFPFELGGRRYVARVEKHDNADGDPDRPQGEHKGITVYHAD